MKFFPGNPLNTERYHFIPSVRDFTSIDSLVQFMEEWVGDAKEMSLSKGKYFKWLHLGQTNFLQHHINWQTIVLFVCASPLATEGHIKPADKVND